MNKGRFSHVSEESKVRVDLVRGRARGEEAGINIKNAIVLRSGEVDNGGACISFYPKRRVAEERMRNLSPRIRGESSARVSGRDQVL